jgi:hypothetical protein
MPALRSRAGKLVAGYHSRSFVQLNLDNLVHGFLKTNLIKYRVEQRPLSIRDDLGNNDDQAGVQFLPAIKLSKIPGIVGDEGEVFSHDAQHQVPVGLAAQPDPIHMPGFVATYFGDSDQGCVEAFVDEKSHAGVPDLNGTRVDDLTLNPCAASFFGLPRAGWAAVQILAISIMRAVSLG